MKYLETEEYIKYIEAYATMNVKLQCLAAVLKLKERLCRRAATTKTWRSLHHKQPFLAAVDLLQRIRAHLGWKFWIF